MKRIVPALIAIAALAPSARGTAFLGMRTGPNLGPDKVDASVSPQPGEHFFDVLLYPFGDDEPDDITEYDVSVRAPRPGITLLGAEKPDNNWVFTSSDAVFSVVEGDAGHLLINASSPDERVNISPPGRNAARIYYSVDPGISPGLYDISLEPGTTRVFTPNPFPPPPVDVTDPGVVQVTPEPAGLTVFLAVSGVLVLRRRRPASALE